MRRRGDCRSVAPAAVLAIAAALSPGRALAVEGEADAALAAGAPAAPQEPSAAPLPPAVEAAIREREAAAVAARREGIGLLQGFLRDSDRPDETAEALFKLAELQWDEARADYLERMGRHEALVEACRADRARCRQVPRQQPKLELAPVQAAYQRILRDHPKFRKLDTVIYLYAFSLRDQGKLEEAVGYFQRLLDEFPRSRFRADAWMAVGEYLFYERQDHREALAAYERVVRYPQSPLYGLALFKTAWCYWKLGQTDDAARRFKDVLDLAQQAKDRSVAEQRRAAELQDQALEYLVELFTEDDSKTAEDAFTFLTQIGGKAYSQRVLRRFADTVYDQTRYGRAAHAYEFLISLDRNVPEAPQYQKRVVESYQYLGEGDKANAEMRRLAMDYGPKSAWAKANAASPKLIAEARALAEELIRGQAKGLHAEAQTNERESRVVDKQRYGQAAEAYAFYLQQFPDAKDAVELRYYRADILYFKLGDNRGAGNEYLLVGRTRPVGKLHRDALLNAMNAFEKIRQVPAGGGKKREITDEDRKFAEAADLYADNFPDDKEIKTVIYKNGQFFYDYGDYDEAIKRFGLILEKYPSSDVAGMAGDRLLECLNAAKDYENIESWARRLKKTKAFSSRDEQQRLDGIVAGAMLKSGEKHAAAEDWEKAAGFFARVAAEYPRHADAPKAQWNAGAAYEKLGRTDEAVAAYEALAKSFPAAPQAPEGLLVAARIEESIAAYAAAAGLYEALANQFPKHPSAPLALKNAGVLRQTLGQAKQAVALYVAFEQRYQGRPETADIAFQRALLLEEEKNHKEAVKAFDAFVRKYPNDARGVEATVREAKSHLALGDDGRARAALASALARFKGARSRSDQMAYHAAEARYLQGDLLFREYERIKIEGRPRQLARALEQKAQLLDEAKKAYLDVLTFKVPQWATAALYRIGQGYDVFARALRGAKAPATLTQEEQNIYREELEKQVIVIEEKALEAYRSGYAKALEIGVYNKHTRLLREALGRLDSAQYPADAEIRPAASLGESTLALQPIEEVRR